MLKCVIPQERVLDTIDDSSELNVADVVTIEWPVGMERPSIGIVLDRSSPPYWTKYKRFAMNNGLPFGIIDIHTSNWIDKAQKYDMIVWRPLSSPSSMEEARRKIYILEKHLGMLCYPSYDTLVLYEDKVMQFEQFRLHEIPAISTFITHSKNEAIEFVNHAEYPLVSKITTGSGSAGVEIVRNKAKARRIIDEVFSERGRWTYWPYLRQHAYVYFQQFIKNARYDLRVIAIGNRVFGYYRYPPKGDFRASGIGEVTKGELPEEAMYLAMTVAQRLNLIMAAVDMVYDPDNQMYQVIEVSTFIRVDTPEQLVVDGTPGMYIQRDGQFEFKPGTYWIQELTLKDLLKDCWIRPRLGNGRG
jgi:glutathione synthase/RimK-type ligase-like ATP-grasp enzyme